MSQPLDIVLVAIGGYGRHYVKPLLESPEQYNARIVGAVDPFAAQSPHLDELKKHDVLIVDTLDAFYAQREAKLAIISSPIHFHADQTVTALEHGTHVLCEKPAAATLAETQRMAEAMDSHQRFAAIGFQASFDPRTLALKSRLMAGDFGKPIRAKSKVGWPRRTSYYQRASWAGKIAMPDGRPVHDSPLNNATAHFMHNLLFLLGDQTAQAARVATLQAECYRSKPIENYDTALLRATTSVGAEVLFYTSHSTETLFGPMFVIECENATITCPSTSGDEQTVHIAYSDGRTETMPAPRHGCMDKLPSCIEAAREDRMDLPCTIRTAMEHTRCVDAIAQHLEIVDLPVEYVSIKQVDEDEQQRYIVGLDQVMHRCFEMNQLPHELGDVPWAVGRPTVEL